MNRRGEYGFRSRSICARDDGWVFLVGADAGVKPSDAERAINQLDTEMEAIVDATYRAMDVDPKVLRRPTTADEGWMQRVRDAKAKAMKSPLWSFWETTISPKYEDWKMRSVLFRKQQVTGDAGITPPMTWADYALWLARIQQLRSDVKSKGIKLETPDLVDLSKGEEASSPDRGKILKWGAIGAIALGGIVALVALASSTKAERAPYERYRYGYRFAR